jgi:hypothetical protein
MSSEWLGVANKVIDVDHSLDLVKRTEVQRAKLPAMAVAVSHHRKAAFD